MMLGRRPRTNWLGYAAGVFLLVEHGDGFRSAIEQGQG